MASERRIRCLTSKYKLEESPEAKDITDYKVRCCVIDAEFKEKTNYNYLHAQMMEALTLETDP